MEFFEEALEMNVDGGFQWIDIHVILLQKVMQLQKHLKIPTLRTDHPTLQLFCESIHFVQEGQDLVLRPCSDRLSVFHLSNMHGK